MGSKGLRPADVPLSTSKPVASVVLSELVDLDLGFITMLILEKQNLKIIIKKKENRRKKHSSVLINTSQLLFCKAEVKSSPFPRKAAAFRGPLFLESTSRALVQLAGKARSRWSAFLSHAECTPSRLFGSDSFFSVLHCQGRNRIFNLFFI